ncbi:MAG: LysR substrate-binding domain-containing protein [Pigmentiphaga sp.]|nr:LysR substrate-binding domain-containing protein [Pigmentiphaga sp.]
MPDLGDERGQLAPLARQATTQFSAILQHSLIGLESDSTLMHLLHRQKEDRQLHVSIQVRGFDVVCRFVQAGLGIGVLPSGSASLYAQSMGLKIVELTDAWAEYTLLLGTRSRDTLNAPSRLLFQSLLESAARDQCAGTPRSK